MISLKRYLDSNLQSAGNDGGADAADILPAVLAAYGSAIMAMGNCSLEACPSVGDDLKKRLGEIGSDLSMGMSQEAMEKINAAVEEQLQEWGRRAAGYYREKASEVKELLLTMTRTAESVDSRDQRLTNQMSMVTARLEQVATLDDVTEIRASIERGAVELRQSIKRMAEEGKATVEKLRQEVEAYQTKLEDVEELASRDALTGVRNRMYVETLIEERIAAGTTFCIAMLDIDGFKAVNDTYGHLIGDELLKMFAAELRSSYRSNDVVGRWGGDEFILLFDCDFSEANSKIDRLCRWICGEYAVRTKGKPLKLRLTASVGLAEHRHQESLKDVISRADTAMYERKAAARTSRITSMNRAS